MIFLRCQFPPLRAKKLMIFTMAHRWVVKVGRLIERRILNTEIDPLARPAHIASGQYLSIAVVVAQVGTVLYSASDDSVCVISCPDEHASEKIVLVNTAHKHVVECNDLGKPLCTRCHFVRMGLRV